MIRGASRSLQSRLCQCGLGIWLISAAMYFGQTTAFAFPEKVLESVVSVLPVWDQARLAEVSDEPEGSAVVVSLGWLSSNRPARG